MKKIHHFILLLCFFPVLSRAQDTPPESVTDSVITAESPSSEADDDGEEGNEKDKSVFLPLWMAHTDSLELRHVSASTVSSQQADEDFWYANYSFKKKKAREEEVEKGRQPLIFHPAFETILWVVVIGGFVTFLIIFLTNGNSGIFRRSRSIRDQEGPDKDLDDIFAINYQQLIDKAEAEGRYNFGVRLLYLRLLRGLAERNIIDYKQDRTNFDYLLQLQPTSYYKDFFRLTRHYEFSWYGQFSLEKEKFAMIRRQFEDFDRNLN